MIAMIRFFKLHHSKQSSAIVQQKKFHPKRQSLDKKCVLKTSFESLKILSTFQHKLYNDLIKLLFDNDGALISSPLFFEFFNFKIYLSFALKILKSVTFLCLGRIHFLRINLNLKVISLQYTSLYNSYSIFSFYTTFDFL